MSIVLSEVSDRILTVTINRPEKLNALNPEVIEGLREAFHGAKANPEVGAVVLTGAGEKAFVAGADIATFQGLTPVAARTLAGPTASSATFNTTVESTPAENATITRLISRIISIMR